MISNFTILNSQILVFQQIMNWKSYVIEIHKSYTYIFNFLHKAFLRFLPSYVYSYAFCSVKVRLLPPIINLSRSLKWRGESKMKLDK